MSEQFAFCPPLQELVAAKASGLSTVNNLLVLREFMRRHKPQRTLEIGLAFGGSCLAMTACHRENGGGTHTAIDPYQHTYWDDAGLLAVDRAGLTANLDFRRESSDLVLPQLVREGAKFGLIYVDGSHYFDHVFVDAYFSVQLLTDDGVVMFDDSTSEHVSKALRFIRRNWPWIEEVDLSPYRADGTSLRYRFARLLGKTQLTAFRCIGEDSRKWGAAPLHQF